MSASGFTSSPKLSFIRKYPAEQAAASSPVARPSPSRRISCHASTTIARPAIATIVPAYADRGSRRRRTSRTQATTSTGDSDTSSSAIPTGSRVHTASIGVIPAATRYFAIGPENANPHADPIASAGPAHRMPSPPALS
ncbi:hypothetical protein WBK31_17855 [Nonomuraea sp. N2-4H]|jgi:hypothetical protein|uniref:hypothetical protein n=1 Tax=unclassified Nonomuraea TaxID=2593643 RepID=UPI00325306B3